MRYGVQFQPETGEIDAGPVRKQGDGEVFVLHSPVTRQVVGAAALWLLCNAQPFRITDRTGTTYELTARIVE